MSTQQRKKITQLNGKYFNFLRDLIEYSLEELLLGIQRVKVRSYIARYVVIVTAQCAVKPVHSNANNSTFV